MEENNNLGNIEFLDSNGKPMMKAKDNPFPETFYFGKFFEEKEYKRFIKGIERQIRTSKEYGTYVEQLRGTISALNVDNILSYITTNDADLEFHHYPLTLYDVVDAVVMQKFFEQVDFTSFDIAKEVLERHYENYIGLVPLSKTTHELAHGGELFISKKQVFGDYDTFLLMYPEGITPELKEKIKEMEELTEKDHPSDSGGLF